MIAHFMGEKGCFTTKSNKEEYVCLISDTYQGGRGYFLVVNFHAREGKDVFLRIFILGGAKIFYFRSSRQGMKQKVLHVFGAPGQR